MVEVYNKFYVNLDLLCVCYVVILVVYLLVK